MILNFDYVVMPGKILLMISLSKYGFGVFGAYCLFCHCHLQAGTCLYGQEYIGREYHLFAKLFCRNVCSEIHHTVNFFIFLSLVEPWSSKNMIFQCHHFNIEVNH